MRRGGKTVTRRADHLLNALGREPETAGLGLEAARVRTDEKGHIVVNRWQQTTAPHIYAAGDCCGPHEIVHIAVQQGTLAAKHAAGRRKGLRPVDRRILLSVLFTYPQVGSIGWRERDLKEKGVRYSSASYPFDDHGKPILMGATTGTSGSSPRTRRAGSSVRKSWARRRRRLPTIFPTAEDPARTVPRRGSKVAPMIGFPS